MKGGTMQPIIILMASLVVVPWLCLASSAAHLPALASENVVDAAAAAALKAEYIKVDFSTSSATPDKYKSFIASVRAGLVSTAAGGSSSSSGIPVLVSEDDPLALETFLNVTLVNKAGRSVSLKMDVSGACFVGYEAGDYSCLLKRSSGCTISSVTCYQNEYPWGGTPTVTVDGDPAAAVAAWRVQDLDAAVSSLFLFPTGGAGATEEDLIRGVAACDVMVAAAAAFPYVERRMSAGMWDGNGVSNDGSLRALRKSWPDLSDAVQESHQGAFAAPVPVQRSNGEWLQVDNVRRAVPLVSFLENAGCKKTTTTTRREAVDQRRLPLLIRSVVQEPDEEDMLAGGAHKQATATTAAAVAACGQAEPTVRLVGPYGRCVDVPYGLYYSGNQVQLWSCKSTGDVNQLWTLKRDGTIRSNGKCLAASSGGKSGARVVIDDCPPRGVPTGRAVWEVRVDGTVALKGSSSSSSLVLAVTSSTLFAGLTVRTDDRGTGQSWTPTNDTAPLVAAIVGFRDLCLQVDSAGAVSVAACGGGGVQWSIYPDGSIRPPAWLLLQWQCLAADASGRVWVKYCDWAGSACERWVFRSDGTIFNTGTGMVLDVVTPSKAATATAASSRQVVVVSPAGANGSPSPTQKWTLML